MNIERLVSVRLHEDAAGRAPDGLLAATLDRVATIPQERTLWRRRSIVKPRRGSRPLLTIAATLVALSLVGALAILGNPRPDPAHVRATATPAPTPTPTSSLVPLPDSRRSVLRYSDDETAVPDGPLSPGSYTLDYIYAVQDTFRTHFTVPAGWAWSGSYLSKGGVGPPNGAAILFYEGPLDIYSDPCHWAAAHSPQPTLAPPLTGVTTATIMMALAAQPSRNGTTPIYRAATGEPEWAQTGRVHRAGMSTELTVPADIAFATCDHGQFRSWGPEVNARSHQGPAQRDLVWAIDVNGGPLFRDHLIVDAASFPETPADVMAEIESILISIWPGHWG